MSRYSSGSSFLFGTAATILGGFVFAVPFAFFVGLLELVLLFASFSGFLFLLAVGAVFRGAAFDGVCVDFDPWCLDDDWLDFDFLCGLIG